ncbi:hypothetical protein cyc_00964 [Cyclospora cayetanensis]|uniref:Uncharacterized protein n=1 Tax=Cyclospora cayetanensis TaxID=88456 RepID=A0A1D3D942_9EIME|nr:hypothetical protein cyc_00964 [Cyclospora cayetanensis]
MVFGPKESPNPGLLAPRGDRASTTLATSACSFGATNTPLPASISSNRRISSSVNTRDDPASTMCTSIQDSLCNTKPHGLHSCQHQPPAGFRSSGSTSHEASLRGSPSLGTVEVLLAEVSTRCGAGATRNSSTSNVMSAATRDPDSGVVTHSSPDRGVKLSPSQLCSSKDWSSIRIEDSFNATLSRGDTLEQRRPSSKNTAVEMARPAALCKAASTIGTSASNGNSTIKGPLRATKSQGLPPRPQASGCTATGSRPRRKPSLEETTEPERPSGFPRRLHSKDSFGWERARRTSDSSKKSSKQKPLPAEHLGDLSTAGLSDYNRRDRASSSSYYTDTKSSTRVSME